MDEQPLSIQSVAQITGLSIYTLRYYEKIGLLNPVNRATNGHRRFTAEDLTWIKFLIRLRATGMPIEQMQHYAELLRQGDATREARRALLEQHRCAVQSHIDELQGHLAEIVKKIEHYDDLRQPQLSSESIVSLSSKA
jgi:DNA-binding transcriptional MerR regulator